MKERKSTFPLDRKARNTYNEQDGFFIEATEKELNFDDEILVFPILMEDTGFLYFLTVTFSVME